MISVIIMSIPYLAETMWFPTAALNEHFTWEEMDQYNAKVTIIKFPIARVNSWERFPLYYKCQRLHNLWHLS